MRWVRRGLWIAAWGCWVWCGLGLYRELPRELGAIVSKLRLKSGEWPQGFVGASTELVTYRRDRDTRTRTLRRWNPFTGAVIDEIGDPISGGPLSDRRLIRHGFSPRFDFLLFGFFGVGIAEHPDEVRHRLFGDPIYARDVHQALDIVAAVWHPLPKYPYGSAALHRNKPWAALYERSGLGGHSVKVIDLHSGRGLFAWDDSAPDAGDRQFLGDPFFLNDDRIVIPTRRKGASADIPGAEDHLEVWRIGGAKKPERIVAAPAARSTWDFGATESGRVLCDLPNSIAVFDVEAGRIVNTWPTEPRHQRIEYFEGAELDSDVLASDGRSLLRAASNRLFDVDANRVLWEPSRVEYVLWTLGDRFETFENWRFVTPWWWTRFVTHGVRDLQTGALLYRTWRPTLRPQSDRGTGPWLMVDGDTIYSMPPPVNWRLLAFCQSILALPLILLWLALLWRRKRRERRLAGATA